MPKKITLVLSPKQAADSKLYSSIATKKLGIDERNVALIRVVKRSVDARQRAVKINLTLEIFEDHEREPDPVHFEYGDVSKATEVVVIGAGPAGLFAALRLIELGLRPIVIERGRVVSLRKQDVAQINRGGEVNGDSNYAFGEGGAGTFSDGKLFTRSKKRGDYNRALQCLVFHGASPDILFEAHPHIGTDKLPRVMTNMKQSIIDAGGEVLFERRVTDLILKGGAIGGVCCGEERIEAAAVVLATGHSAADIYELLHRRGVRIEAKPFAMGLRIEHPQALIDSIQYSLAEGQIRGEYLSAANYSLVSQQRGRGVYSFCMCPGGFIVPAMTDAQQSVVNGMSPSHRNSPYANSGLVTEVRLSDFEHLRERWGELSGLKYQQWLEMEARKNGGDKQIAPAQCVADFVQGRSSRSLVSTSYIPGVTSTRFERWLPDYMSSALRGGLVEFGRRMRGFVSNEAMVLGVESRTSSAVRVPRDAQTLQHPDVVGLFPTGEGAGYAGGIISAALDGERVAQAAASLVRSGS